MLEKRPGQFDSRVVEPGPSPILTPHGIVLIYNGADEKLVYRTGVAVFDRNDPSKLSWAHRSAHLRSREGMGESRPGAQRGLRRRHGDSRAISYLFYYGGADKYVGVAEAPKLQ